MPRPPVLLSTESSISNAARDMPLVVTTKGVLILPQLRYAQSQANGIRLYRGDSAAQPMKVSPDRDVVLVVLVWNIACRAFAAFIEIPTVDGRREYVREGPRRW